MLLFKSDTMNALVAQELMRDGYEMDEAFQAMDEFSQLLQEGRSGNIYKLALFEGTRVDEAGRSPAASRKAAGRAIGRADRAQTRAREAEAGQATAEGERDTRSEYIKSEEERTRGGSKKAYDAGKEKGAEGTAEAEAAGAASERDVSDEQEAHDVTRADHKASEKDISDEQEAHDFTRADLKKAKKKAKKWKKRAKRGQQGGGDDGGTSGGDGGQGGGGGFDVGRALRHASDEDGGGSSGKSGGSQRGGGRGHHVAAAGSGDEPKSRKYHKREQKHRQKLERDAHERKHAGREKWGDLLRKTVKGGAKLVRRAGERIVNLGAKDKSKAKNKPMDKGNGNGNGNDTGNQGPPLSMHQPNRAKERLERQKREVASSYSPLENKPHLRLVSEHLKVDQSNEQDRWQSLMEGVVHDNRQTILDEAKKKRNVRRGEGRKGN
jgi:hypothetical protein